MLKINFYYGKISLGNTEYYIPLLWFIISINTFQFLRSPAVMKPIQVVQRWIFQTYLTCNVFLLVTWSPLTSEKLWSMEHTHRYVELKYNQLIISKHKRSGFLDASQFWWGRRRHERRSWTLRGKDGVTTEFRSGVVLEYVGSMLGKIQKDETGGSKEFFSKNSLFTSNCA